MTIEVSLRFWPVNQTGTLWALRPFDRVVWRCDGSGVTVTRIATPAGYVAGLLTGLVDGRAVDVHDFDEALAAVGETRERIETEVWGA